VGLTCRASIAGTNLLFDDFGRDGFWDMWQWKLDPYRIREDDSWKPDAVIRNACEQKAEILESGAEILSSQQSGFYRREVLRASDGGTIWRFARRLTDEPCVSYHISEDYRQISLLTDHSESAGMLPFEYLGQMMPALQLKQGALTFHGALLEYAGSAFAVCASSGTGKTTHARLWRDHKNALILNGDRAVIRKKQNEWTAWGTPWSGTSGEQINRCAPLKALVLLERGSDNKAVRLSSRDAVRAVMTHLLYPGWDMELTLKAFDLADDLLQAVPVCHLQCRPDADGVETLCRAIYGVL